MNPLRYTLVCVVAGFALGWMPWLFHGPIPQKLDAYFLDGSVLDGGVAVWAWYTARMLIGTWVGLTTWPQQWWIRGPLCGLLGMLPVTVVSLAVPACGPPCMGWNLTTGAVVGLFVGGAAFVLTGRESRNP